MKYEIVKTHITDIVPGDTVEHNGRLMTVCRSDIKNGATGMTIFGDSYRCGHLPVKKAIIFRARG